MVKARASSPRSTTCRPQLPVGGWQRGIDATTTSWSGRQPHDAGYVYGSVILLCAITFRSWRAVVVAVLPLVLTSCWRGLDGPARHRRESGDAAGRCTGVGIGVDYALYLLSVQLAQQRLGLTLAQAYQRRWHSPARWSRWSASPGRRVVTWAWSPIKFQADMGILLTFMFVWNMLGALILIPALSHFLLQGRLECTGMPHCTPSSRCHPPWSRRTKMWSSV